MRARSFLAFVWALLSCVALLSATVHAGTVSTPELLATSSSWLVSGRTAHVSVQVSGVSGAATITTVLLVADGSGSPLAQASTTLADASVPHTASLQLAVPSGLAAGSYTLRTAVSSTVAVPSVSATVQIVAANRGILVETDKSLYQQSQNVSIVVIGVDYDLKPLPSRGPYVIELVAPSRFKIRRWASESSDEYGFLSLGYKLDAECELGNYTVNVLSADAARTLLASTSFLVSRYVLPKFGVSVACSPSKIVSSTTLVTCNIFANYSFGASVQGVANVSIAQEAPYYWWTSGGDAVGGVDAMPAVDMIAPGGGGSSYPIAPGPTSTLLFQQLVTLVDGRATITLHLSPSSTLPPPIPLDSSIGSSIGTADASITIQRSFGDLIVNVSVVESATESLERSVATIPSVWSAIDLRFVASDATFKPGMPFTVLLVARDQEGSPVAGKTFPVTVSSSGSRSSSSNVIDVATNAAGLAVISVPVPIGTTSLTVSAYSTEYSANTGLFPAAVSPSNTFLSLTLDTSANRNGQEGVGDPIAVGGVASFDVQLLLNRTGLDAVAEAANPSTSMDVHWVASARGDVVASGVVSLAPSAPGAVPPAFPSHLFSSWNGRITLSPITASMSPLVKILAWFVAPASTEVVADAVRVVVAPSSPLSVSAAFNVQSAEPGTPVEINVATSSPARVLLTSVDQALLLLAGGAGQRINLQQVFDLLSSAPASAAAAAAAGADVFTSYWYAPSLSTKALFHGADLVVATSNALFDSPAPSSPVWPMGGPEVAVGGGDMAGMPPLAAAPMAPADSQDTSSNGGSGSGAAGAAPSPTRVRSFFPETWIRSFVDTSASSSGSGSSGASGTLRATAPDSITTFSLHAMALSQTEGIGFPSLSVPSASLRVFQSFFVDAKLPASAVRGEVLPVVVPVFNYLPDAANVQVTFGVESGQATITDKTGSPLGGTSVEGSRTNVLGSVVVPPNSVASITFFLQPRALGQEAVTIHILAVSGAHSDAIQRTLTVHPEGFAQNFVINSFVDMDAAPTSSMSVAADASRSLTLLPSLPAADSIVPESTRVKFSVTGDLMSDVIANIGSLISLPTGCGEQNMLTMAPLTYAVRYATGTTLLTADLQALSLRYLSSGYARELTFQHPEGSFSAFGTGDAQGSTWLSAFVLKVFAQSAPYVYIDPAVLSKIGEYLVSTQRSEGSFENRGVVVHGSELFGGLQGDVSFTAYVVVALKEADLQPAAVEKALAYLQKNLARTNGDVYSQALVAYALVRCGASSPALTTLISSLAAGAVTDADGGVHLRTSADASITSPGSADAMPWCYSCRASSFDVEATAYFLLVRLAQNDMGSALGLSKFLLAKRNGQGGYQSTQDTCMGIEALGAYAAATRSARTELSVKLFPTGSTTTELATFNLDASNADLLQSLSLPALSVVGVGPLTLVVSGVGKVVASLSVAYNTHQDLRGVTEPIFELQVGYNEPAGSSESSSARQVVTPCIALSPSLASGSKSVGMTLAEVALFTGYSPDRQSLDELVSASSGQSAGVKRWEYSAQKNSVQLYFQELALMPRLDSNPLGASTTTAANEFVCVQFSASRSSVAVGRAAPALSQLYAYYSPAQKASFALARESVSTSQAPVIRRTPNGSLSGAAAPASARVSMLVASLAMVGAILAARMQ